MKYDFNKEVVSITRKTKKNVLRNQTNIYYTKFSEWSKRHLAHVEAESNNNKKKIQGWWYERARLRFVKQKQKPTLLLQRVDLELYKCVF